MYEPTMLGYAILGLLYQRPQTGYEIRKMFEATAMRHYSSSPGTIYPALKRLQGEGLIEKIRQETPPSREREVFALTGDGRHRLNEWLNRPVEPREVIEHLHDLLLKFAFLDDQANPGACRQLLVVVRDTLIPYIEELETYAANNEHLMTRNGRSTLELGIENFRVHIRWCERQLHRFHSNSESC